MHLARSPATLSNMGWQALAAERIELLALTSSERLRARTALVEQGRLTHCNLASEGSANRAKQQAFGQQNGQQWGMGQQQYQAQGMFLVSQSDV